MGKFNEVAIKLKKNRTKKWLSQSVTEAGFKSRLWYSNICTADFTLAEGCIAPAVGAPQRGLGLPAGPGGRRRKRRRRRCSSVAQTVVVVPHPAKLVTDNKQNRRFEKK